MSDMPVILMQLSLYQFRITELDQVFRERTRFVINNFVNSAVAPVDSIIIVAFACVGPIGDKDASIRTVLNADASKPRIVGEHEILAVMGDITGALAFQDVVVHAVAVEVASEEGVAKAVGPVIGEVDHGSDMGMAAAGVAVRAHAAA